jgi:hypothetical protein
VSIRTTAETSSSGLWDEAANALTSAIRAAARMGVEALPTILHVAILRAMKC